ncbi:hypothetical protein HMH01_16890 [Halovulum dunhuangense]|uniref:Uncharacterized protein n=1 Tax=Halovulum dunhuangense TaxID=1505036 RepID=A0A849L6T2_9RHOB|nr:hypothetical protein [Halovulum dunhuangense]NNU82116.1 hypothetical protein [Halovulum dunhuangense]
MNRLVLTGAALLAVAACSPEEECKVEQGVPMVQLKDGSWIEDEYSAVPQPCPYVLITPAPIPANGTGQPPRHSAPAPDPEPGLDPQVGHQTEGNGTTAERTAGGEQVAATNDRNSTAGEGDPDVDGNGQVDRTSAYSSDDTRTATARNGVSASRGDLGGSATSE